MFTNEKAEAGSLAAPIARFLERLDNCRIPMHSVLLMRHDKLLFEGYYAPYKADTLHRMFSICKTMNALAVGLLEEEGKLSLDDPIIRYFPDKAPANVHPWIAQMTIRNLLMMRSPHASTTYKYSGDMEWLESFFTVTPTHKPGTVFHYDTSAAHTLCMLVQRLSGKPMLDYLKDRVLREIGWSESSYVILNQFGDPHGGSGLMATPMDMLLLGRLLLNHGNWDGKQLLPRAYVDAAVSSLSPSVMMGPINAEMQGYGYQIWRAEHNSFVCYGMGGQLAVCLPDYDMVLVTTADTQGIGGGNQLIYNSFFEELLPAIDKLEGGSDAHAQPVSGAFTAEDKHLADIASKLAIAPVAAWTHTVGTSVQDRINGKRYGMDENPAGFHVMGLDFMGDEGVLTYGYGENTHTLPFGLTRCVDSVFPAYGLACTSSGGWIAEDTFYIRCHIVDTAVGSVHFELVFGDGDVTVFMKKIEETILNEFVGHLHGVLY